MNEPLAPLAEDRVSRPWSAIAVIACGLLLIPWLWPFASGPSTAVAPWLAGAACVALLALVISSGISRTLLAAMIVTAPFAAWRSASVLEPAALAGALLVMALAAGAGAKLLGRGDADVIARAWWIAAVASTLLALLQYFGLSGALSPWVSATDAGTAYANLRQRNQFASLTAIGLAALLWEARRGTKLAWLLPAAAWIALGNAASVSRTGLVEFVALAVLAAVWPGRSRRQAQVAGCALAAYGAGVLLLPLLLEAATGIAGENLWARVSHPDSCAGRAVLWSNVVHLIRERPWLGWGWGELDYGHYMTLYPGTRFCDILDNAHSLPLHLAVELGVPFALVVVGLVLWAVLRAQPWREADTHRQLAWAVLAVIAIHSLLEYPLWYVPFQIACGLALGMLWPRDVVLADRPIGRMLAPVALACALAYAGWEYLRVSQIYLSPEERMADWREDPLARLHGIWLFREHVQFAELTLSTLTRENARWTFELSQEMLHYSPEPRVAEKLIESALLLKRDDVLRTQLARYRAAFPKDHALWAREHGVKD